MGEGETEITDSFDNDVKGRKEGRRIERRGRETEGAGERERERGGEGKGEGQTEITYCFSSDVSPHNKYNVNLSCDHSCYLL